MTDDRVQKDSQGLLPPLSWTWPGVTLRFPPALPYICGILNVTPDSFSDGGSYGSAEDAAARALEMAKEGAHIVDVGGQSTRPGFEPVPLQEEEERVLPVLAMLAERLGGKGRKTLISIDTDKPALAEKVFSLGLADILNDESGGDISMARIAAKYGAPLILMHRPLALGRGSLACVVEDLLSLARQYTEAGLPAECIALDPGLGFGKTEGENLSLLSNCRLLLNMGSPLYIGASRKGFIGKASGNPEASRRLAGSLAAALWAAQAGAAFVRVHDVRETAEAFATMAALRNALMLQ